MGCSSSALALSIKERSLCNELLREDDFFDAYCLGPKLGQGSFGQVRATIGLQNGASEIIAVKVATCETFDDTMTRSKLYREVDVWRAIPKHGNVVSLHEVFFNSGVCFMLMERCSCNFIHHLGTLDELNECTIGKMLHQMLQAISHLHGTARIVHRDIKPDNFLIAQDGHTVKLCDFGLSIRLPESGLLNGLAGTAPFMSPEMLRRCGYNEKADVWSLGVLTYTLLFGNFPYAPANMHDSEQVSKAMHIAILAGNAPKFHLEGCDDQTHSQVCMNFVKSLMIREYEQRPSAQEALQSTYIVMSQQDRRAEGVSLSSLQPVLKAARKQGVFKPTSTVKQTLVDTLLSQKHKEKHGSPIPTMAQMESRFADKPSKEVSGFSIGNNSVSTDAGSSKNSCTTESCKTSKAFSVTDWEDLLAEKLATSSTDRSCKLSL